MEEEDGGEVSNSCPRERCKVAFVGGMEGMDDEMMRRLWFAILLPFIPPGASQSRCHPKLEKKEEASERKGKDPNKTEEDPQKMSEPRRVVCNSNARSDFGSFSKWGFWSSNSE